MVENGQNDQNSRNGQKISKWTIWSKMVKMIKMIKKIKMAIIQNHMILLRILCSLCLVDKSNFDAAKR